MVKFCPKCECILRKKIEGTSAFLACKNCGFKEILQENLQITRKFALDNDPIDNKEELIFTDQNDTNFILPRKEHNIRQKQENLTRNSSKDSKNSIKSSSKSIISKETQLNKLEQELLLLEIKKNNLIKTLDSYEHGPKQEEILIEILNYLIRIQDLKIHRFNHIKQHEIQIEQEIPIQPDSSEPTQKTEELPIEFVEKGEEKKSSSNSSTLIRSSKITQIWVSAIRDEIAKSHPELIFKKEKYWGSFETEMDHWAIGYLLPLRNKIWIITCMNDATKEKVLPQINSIDADEKIKLATAFLNKSMRILQAHFTS